MYKRNAVDLAATRQGFGGTDNLLHRPIAAFHQNIRLDFGNQLMGRSLPLPCRRTDSSVFNARIKHSPNARACAR